MAQTAEWIPLMDYAIKNGVSLSTLRRHIKSNKIAYKLENGKYFLPDDEPTLMSNSTSTVEKLTLDLQKAQEEIVELKTLIAFYEETGLQQNLDV
jgi:hypothetical protein